MDTSKYKLKSNKYDNRKPLKISRLAVFTIVIIVINLILIIPISYRLGQLNPNDKVMAKVIAKSYDQGRQAVINMPPTNDVLDKHCGSWLMESNLLSARKRICGK